MALARTPRPRWLTFDCYGTLVQWDEGLRAAVAAILAKGDATIDEAELIRIYDAYEHAFEQDVPYRSFADCAGMALQRAMADLGSDCAQGDVEVLLRAIPTFPPFPETVGTLASLKAAGHRLCIVSNTDDGLIAGNVAQLGGTVDVVVTAEQARAYKPSREIFAFAHRTLGVTPDEVVHICASPHLDLVAARDIGFRCIWIDRGTGRAPPDDYRPDATLPRLDAVLPLFTELGWMDGSA